MDSLIDELKRGHLSYITTKRMEENLRDQVVAKIDSQFLKECFENLVLNFKEGLFVLTGGAATLSHLSDDNNDIEKNKLKCLDLEYYNDNGLNLHVAHSSLQHCVNIYYEKLKELTENVRASDLFTIFKCYQNGAFKLQGPTHFKLLQNINCIKTVYNKQFDLVRYCLQINAINNNITEYRGQKIKFRTSSSIKFNVYFVNVLVMKHQFINDRCIKSIFLFGNNYQVLVPSLQRVLNDQILCLLKDIFTDKYEYKVKRRTNYIKKLFAKLPNDARNLCVNQINDCNMHRKETIVDFIKRILDVNGPLIGCRKLIHVYLNSDTFNEKVPSYVADQINYPHRDHDQRWKEFMSTIYLFE
ncbi:ac18 [Oxyplax ochracea nucleopolyhedrovirus]|uniref:Ac18 n=1 Tax=Oxyplax ochracea nucleopolyhedrovirus TaxID=2083176 RepID=A0A2L0WU71_9ABAC|nr:ac18 [Oxyplax ochracea nucleopolyhedrovirus]AVA31198.1 ac18 [Oxyplax ochracea nucleopolyhedrovirus]